MNREGQIKRKSSQWHILWITHHYSPCQKMLQNSNSGAAISLLRYSTYQQIDDSFKTPIQPTTAKLNTANGLPMTALGMMALHLRIADFKFTHNFVICNRLPDTEIILVLIFKRNSQFPMLWIGTKIVSYKKMENSLHIQKTVNRRQQ